MISPLTRCRCLLCTGARCSPFPAWRVAAAALPSPVGARAPMGGRYPASRHPQTVATGGCRGRAVGWNWETCTHGPRCVFLGAQGNPHITQGFPSPAAPLVPCLGAASHVGVPRSMPGRCRPQPRLSQINAATAPRGPPVPAGGHAGTQARPRCSRQRNAAGTAAGPRARAAPGGN